MNPEIILLGIYTAIMLVLGGIAISLFWEKKDKDELEPPAKKETYERKILVPGKGVFVVPEEKRSPKYHTDADLWVKEQDDLTKGH